MFNDKIYKPQGSELAWEFQKLTGQPAAIIDLSGKTFSYQKDEKELQAPLYFDYSDTNDIRKLISILKNKGLICVISPGLTMGRCEPVIGKNKAKLIKQLENGLKAIEKQNNKLENNEIKNKITSELDLKSKIKNKKTFDKKENQKSYSGLDTKLDNKIDFDFEVIEEKNIDSLKGKKNLSDPKIDVSDFEIIDKENVDNLKKDNSKPLHSKLDTEMKNENSFDFEIVDKENIENSNVNKSQSKKISPLKLVKQKEIKKQKKGILGRIKSLFKSSQKNKKDNNR